MLNFNEKKLYKFIFIVACCLFFIPGVVLAEDPEQGEVVIYTDGTYSDHEVIEACEVGKLVKLDIGSFDTAYINNNFDYNANIDGYVYFECGAYNDIKLAYYGINSTIYVSYENILNEAMLNALSTFDFSQDNIIVAKWASLSNLNIFDDISNYNYNTGNFNYVGYYGIDTNGSISYNSSSGTAGSSPTSPDRQVLYKKINGEVIFNGLPDEVTIKVNITGSVDPLGSGSIEGLGKYPKNSLVSLTAIPSSGYVFSHWSNGSYNETITFTALNSASYVAYFVPQPTMTYYNVSASASPDTYGYVTGEGSYIAGQVCSLHASAYPGYKFSHWSDGSTYEYKTFNVNSNIHYTAYFEVDPDYVPPETDTILISGSVSPLNSGTIEGLGYYEPGETITLNAIANDGYTFLQWENGDRSSTRTLNTLNNISVTAYFISNDIESSGLLLTSNYYINEFICTTSSYTYRNRVRKINGVNFDVYAKYTNDTEYQLIAEDINEYIISSVEDYKVDGSCTFVPYVTNSKTQFVDDGVVLSSSDGAVLYKFVLTEKEDPLVNGTTESNISKDKNDAQNEELDSVIGEYNQIEQGFKDDLDNTLDVIDFNFDFGNIIDFTKSANFVSTQFNQLTNNPFGSLVGFSLAVGLALLIMGRRL